MPLAVSTKVVHRPSLDRFHFWSALDPCVLSSHLVEHVFAREVYADASLFLLSFGSGGPSIKCGEGLEAARGRLASLFCLTLQGVVHAVFFLSFNL